MPRGPLGILYSGDLKPGTKLLARPNAIVDDEGIKTETGRFTWYRNGTEIAEGQTYFIHADDRGHDLSVRYSYMDGDGNFETVQSKAVSVPDPDKVVLTAMYEAILGRKPDNEGLRFWLTVKRRDAMTWDKLVPAFLEGVHKDDKIL